MTIPENTQNLESILEVTGREYEQTQSEIKEIELLIQQSAVEVERLAQRNAQLTNYVSQFENDFSTVPREDIKEGYEELNSAQQKLFTMRGQLEKLQSDQKNMTRLSEMQRTLLELTNSADLISAESGGAAVVQNSDVIRVIQAQEQERQSLVKRMHDGPASSLSNFILQAEICQRFFSTDPDRAQVELDALKAAAAHTFNDVKNFIFDLRPMMLDDLGVIPTLRRYVEAFEEQSGIPSIFSITGMENRVESHIEVTVFRVVQELMNNARRHGQPANIQVQVDMDDERVSAIVEDNGRGFDVDEVISDSEKHTIGLSTLQDRIAMLGGTMDIESNPGKGTRVEFRIPITTPEE